MKIIISPAKKMRIDYEAVAPVGLPVYIEHTKTLLKTLKAMSYEELQKLWGCNAEIAELNFQRLQGMELEKAATPAIEAYDGIQYKYMAPSVFANGEFTYVQDHLRILSGFYGILKPLDGVVPYRLEMQAKLKVGAAKNLYSFWGECLYRELTKDDHIIINLASKEYSACIEKYLQPKDIYITCIFAELSKGKVVQKGTYAKMARGEMVRYLAENNVTEVEQLKGFNYLDYRFASAYSNEKEFVFLRKVEIKDAQAK